MSYIRYIFVPMLKCGIKIVDFKFMHFYWKFIKVNTSKTVRLGKLAR